ncbi:hypothetical protein OB955_08130 [Halobacteria archaeon AArc-m2/3/4]|uniref:DUF8056 domain-containing protein n=1 Tax=Natronoglomus mannanivorans TaxID=2979990 RepID=A0AAP3E0R7_9EURY|nr:hypothetical protein [Halobacteria archaeon AArc-xg1-1]MCU4972705.1 hypothetical protein [Halobacteria archaeon AArc-m2/3/4]
MTEAAGKSYDGLPGAFRFAFSRSNSWLFKLYVAVALVLAGLVTIIFVFALIVLIADTVDASDGSISLLRSFFVLVGLLVVLPILAPVLFVARRHRREIGDDTGYDRRLASTGFLFIFAVYLGLVVSTPPEQQTSVDGALGPVLEVLYGLPSIVGLVPPVVAVLVIYGTHRLSR